MIRFRGTVQYEGGEVASWQAGSAAMVAWEAYCRRQGLAAYDGNNPQTMTAYLAFTVLGIREGFEVWLASVVDVDANPTEEAAAAAGVAIGEPVPPTPEEASRA